jgi:endonuclease YncB( thermonuclease family)
VRLHGIDAPELDQTFWWRGQQIACGAMSLAALVALIAGITVLGAFGAAWDDAVVAHFRA